MARAEFSTAVTNSIELKWKPLFSILDLSKILFQKIGLFHSEKNRFSVDKCHGIFWLLWYFNERCQTRPCSAACQKDLLQQICGFLH